ncbi:MAG TPA: DUF5666 domain-containing protein [Candidatus Sulfotelmatobacter sp.]|nr:DUF5666 domain-containing protein [Candidatus Sulfotelmatobacter sp.]
MRKMLLMTMLVNACFVVAHAQTQERTVMNMPPGDNVVGKVTAVSKDSLTVAPMMGGEPVTIKIGEATRIMKERQAVKLEEIKADETVFARGKLNGNVMDAALVGVVNPEMIQRAQQAGGAGAGMMAGFNREDLGKKFIIGEVKAINETKLTISRPDGHTQDIEVDENTSFKKGTESITLPDIKIGDFVRGRGELKENVFVPKELNVGGRPQMQIMMGGPGSPAPEHKTDSAAPAATPSNIPAPAPPK